MSEMTERQERLKKRSLNPFADILIHLKTSDFTEDIEYHKELVKKIIENPILYYKQFRKRLSGNYINEFPELKGTVLYLIQYLFQEDAIYRWFESDHDKFILIKQLINKIISIDIVGRFNYPYRQTILLIENLLELIDLYHRSNIESESEGTELVNEKVGPYYHIFRYRSYMTTFLNSEYGIPNNIIFPTFYNIGATDLIKIRCVPILFMGVVTEPVYVDQYLNTPLDFWAHDIQHSKRQIHETLRYFDVYIKHSDYYNRRTLYDIRSEMSFYEYMENYTKNIILPIIKVPSKEILKTMEPGEQERVKAFNKIKKMIIFEVVHEKAWPITQNSLCRNISLRYDEFPVENLHLSDQKIEPFHYLFADPTTIANVVGKLRHGFYDKIDDPKSYIVPLRYRTSRNVAICAKQLMEQIKCKKIPDWEYYLALATDRHSMQEFEDVPSIEIQDRPRKTIYPEGYPLNVYTDNDLSTIFEPMADLEESDTINNLHKLSEVERYDKDKYENEI